MIGISVNDWYLCECHALQLLVQGYIINQPKCIWWIEKWTACPHSIMQKLFGNVCILERSPIISVIDQICAFTSVDCIQSHSTGHLIPYTGNHMDYNAYVYTSIYPIQIIHMINIVRKP